MGLFRLNLSTDEMNILRLIEERKKEKELGAIFKWKMFLDLNFSVEVAL